MSIKLMTQAEAKAHEEYIGTEILREAFDNMMAQGWTRLEILDFIRSIVEE